MKGKEKEKKKKEEKKNQTASSSLGFLSSEESHMYLI